jgi:small nuclear ribonucleoprotein (snRNP)-like protein
VRVRVTIRRAASVRGHCYGWLMAFDRHFNMVLLDVDEHYTRWEWRSTDSPLVDVASSSSRPFATSVTDEPLQTPSTIDSKGTPNRNAIRMLDNTSLLAAPSAPSLSSTSTLQWRKTYDASSVQSLPMVRITAPPRMQRHDGPRSVLNTVPSYFSTTSHYHPKRPPSFDIIDQLHTTKKHKRYLTPQQYMAANPPVTHNDTSTSSSTDDNDQSTIASSAESLFTQRKSAKFRAQYPLVPSELDSMPFTNPDDDHDGGGGSYDNANATTEKKNSNDSKELDYPLLPVADRETEGVIGEWQQISYNHNGRPMVRVEVQKRRHVNQLFIRGNDDHFVHNHTYFAVI